ncbi:tumor necrosis factor receptor superfamily member 16-like isoform X1 [Limulus polyphemus]|uniref:Tumor necrosis factor receptor superfamily member 16-like isoform X1 n=1 Tax=Limulus polyphemus TaxID=6850 RepID=A0ABM1SBS7_LIMPO|nr:tumor necrosis factor receptor superfamily member 16-like isoform X1 [Limulus polyphemus]
MIMKLHMLVFSLFLVLWNWVGYNLCEIQSAAKATSCQSCPPGFGVKYKCTNTEETQCVPCRSGDTFSTTSDDETVCIKCSECPENSRLIEKCNATHDIQCACEKGFYMDTEEKFCKHCELCSHGWGVARQCSATKNTMCRKCPPGTYSGLLSGTLGCELCTTCHESQIMLQECTPIQDTICIDKNLHRGRLLPTDERRKVPSEVVNFTQNNVIPVYCTILVAVLLGILMFIMLRWRLQRQTRTKATHCDEVTSRISQGGSSDSSKSVLLSDSDQSLKLVTIQPLQQTMKLKVKLKELFLVKQRELEAALDIKRDDGKDWRGLSRQLGYSTSHISTF